jgi:phenylpyruvate tautomerase PptA (4-oxalocrotonate tautomerase family)
MPVIKAHVPKRLDAQAKQAYLSELRECLMVLGIEPTHGHVLLYETAPEDRLTHAARDAGFCYIEVHLFSGRADVVKHSLALRLTEATLKRFEVHQRDVQVALFEVERRHWASGGQPTSQMDLGY